MKTINVTNEIYDFLMRVSKEMNTQDNRATAMPYFFQVQFDKQFASGEGIGNEAWLFDGDLLEKDQEIKEAVCEFKDWDDNSKEFDKLSNHEIELILEKIGFNRVWVDYRKVYSNAFFTESACKKHIEHNKHHYSNPVDFLSYASRNSEMEMMQKFLVQLTGGQISK